MQRKFALSSARQFWYANQLINSPRYICKCKPCDRKYCSLPKSQKLPALMEFPEVIWPSFTQSIKNWVLVNFIIRPYFDNDFKIKDFIYGTKRAITVISSLLVKGDFDSLTEFVSKEALAELKPVVEKLTISQRKGLQINSSDIYLTFPHTVGIMFEDKNEVQKRFVEITMVYHMLQGLTEMRERGEEIPWNMGTIPEYQGRVFVCNYRFIKEFTAGSESDWTVNIINHFKPIDLLKN